jgi:hypothetical protein
MPSGTVDKWFLGAGTMSHDDIDKNPDVLRRMAARFRRLALSVNDQKFCEAARQLAGDYDAKAATLELEQLG